MTDLLAAAVILFTLAGMLTRPRGRSEAWFAGLGGAAMLLVGAVAPVQALDEVRQSADVLLFLLGMMVLTAATERAGVYEHLAEWCARLARGSGTLLFANVFVLGALVTTLLSLDVMVIVVTPIVYAVAVRRRIDPLPFMFACTFVANTGSMLLPISNLTNLLVYHDAGIPFVAFAKAMWPAEIAAVGVNFLLFRWIFRRALPRKLPSGVVDDLPATDWWFWTSALALASTLLGLFALGLAERPLSVAALAGAAVILPVGLRGGRIEAATIAREVSWPLFVFVVGMALIVRGAEETFLVGVAAPVPGHWAGALATAAGLSALGSNVVNNVPMTLLALPFVDGLAGRTREATIWGVLAGVNIGPTLTTYGSLATMLWLTTIRKRGMQVSAGLYLRVGIVTMPIVLAAAVIALLIAGP